MQKCKSEKAKVAEEESDTQPGDAFDQMMAATNKNRNKRRKAGGGTGMGDERRVVENAVARVHNAYAVRSAVCGNLNFG